jgi:predicted 2-oxoglutarate/Fe(II)-dependent dioxygenase YbiX
MPRPEFFGKLGLFVVSEFLDLATCGRLRSEILEAASRKGKILAKTREFEVDDSIRRVLCSDVPKSTEILVEARLAQLKPQLEEHFQTSLTGCDGPYFFRYGPEDFYKPHRDVVPDSPAEVENRRVSVIVFLNAQGEDSSAEDCYGGGALTFYGLIQGAQWENCGFPLEATPGLLVAFRPGILHEVSPVAYGQRFTIAAWFTGGSSAESSAESSAAGPHGSELKVRAQVRKRSNRAVKGKAKTPRQRKRQ